MASSATRAMELDHHRRLIAARMLRHASEGTWDGRLHPLQSPYFLRCVHDDGPTGTRLILTRDIGHHTSGWLKNPDYERCLHLSLSSWDPATGKGVGHLDRRAAREWAKAILGSSVQLAWVESPKSPEGRELDVWHWRLFCDAHWQPMLPRKEVYSLDFTELGWRSASQVLEEDGVRVESVLYPG